MAHLAQAQLLRGGILVLGVLLVTEAVAQADSFAPEATPGIDADIVEMGRAADALADDLAGRLVIQDGAGVDGAILPSDNPLDHPLARRLLGLAQAGEDGPGRDEPASSEPTEAFLFVSLGMPDESLRQAMVEGKELGVPLVLQGFVGNSIPATQERIGEIWGDLDPVGEMMIDPLMFKLFDIENVPALVVVPGGMAFCAESGCDDAVAPPYDIVRGNAPIGAGLERVRQHGGVGAQAASLLLEDRL